MNSHEEYDEKEYAPVINHLKSLKKVNAPVDFEDELQKQIKHVLSKEKKSIFNKYIRKNLFFSSTMYLSLFTLMLILIIFLFVYFYLLRSGNFKHNGSTPKENPKTEQVRAPETIPKK
jgi:predicted PurR-regulated permease PerM